MWNRSRKYKMKQTGMGDLASHNKTCQKQHRRISRTRTKDASLFENSVIIALYSEGTKNCTYSMRFSPWSQCLVFILPDLSFAAGKIRFVIDNEKPFNFGVEGLERSWKCIHFILVILSHKKCEGIIDYFDRSVFGSHFTRICAYYFRRQVLCSCHL